MLGFQCRVERQGCSDALISPEPQVTRDPPSLGPEKADGEQSSRGKGQKAICLLCTAPTALSPRPLTLLLPTQGPRLCQAHEYPPDYCTSAAATGPPPGAHAQVCPVAACTGEGPPSGRGEELATPTGQMTRQGWGMEN